MPKRRKYKLGDSLYVLTKYPKKICFDVGLSPSCYSCDYNVKDFYSELTIKNVKINIENILNNNIIFKHPFLNKKKFICSNHWSYDFIRSLNIDCGNRNHTNSLKLRQFIDNISRSRNYIYALAPVLLTELSIPYGYKKISNELHYTITSYSYHFRISSRLDLGSSILLSKLPTTGITNNIYIRNTYSQLKATISEDNFYNYIKDYDIFDTYEKGVEVVNELNKNKVKRPSMFEKSFFNISDI